METKNGPLPSDLALCHRMIQEMSSALAERDRKIEQLSHHLEQIVRMHFGPRSERVDPNQLAMFDPGQAPSAPEPPSAPAVPAGARSGSGHGRRRLPKDLPRKRIEHPVPPEDLVCPECRAGKVRIGEEVSEQLEYVPASACVIEHVRPKYACRCCQEHVTIADKPYQPIDKGLPGPGMLAHVVTSKYADHLPLYRQENIFWRQGLDISRSTMCGWMAAVARLLDPLCAQMKAEVLKSKALHTDDTPVPVQDEASPGKTKTGRLWVYLGDRGHPYSVFDYTPSRSRDGPKEFLAGYKGYLHADAFGGYDGIYAGGDITEVACMAHARRKFFDAQSSDPVGALEAVARIKQLYEVETAARELSSQERYALRLEQSKPKLDDLGKWLELQSRSVLPKSPLGGAIGYALNQWTALNRYLEDGDLDIDNNAAERALRCVAIGRKNWLFAGSDHGGRTAAALYTLVVSAKLHEIDPFAYLRDVIDRFPAHPASRIAEFLPDKWKETRDKKSAEAPALAAIPQ
jgi:transposase